MRLGVVVSNFIEEATARHLDLAPFAVDPMQSPDIAQRVLRHLITSEVHRLRESTIAQEKDNGCQWVEVAEVAAKNGQFGEISPS